MYNGMKKWLLISCILLLALSSVGCMGKPSNETKPAEQAEAKGSIVPMDHLRIGVHAFTAGLEATRTSNADAQIQYNIYDTLILRDPYSKDLKFIPGLAESWKQIEPTVWEFKLRKNVKFHDGTVMDAEDVAFTLNKIFKQEDPRFLNAYGRYFNNFEKVEVVDTHTVKIHTMQPDPLVEVFLSDLSGAITSKEYVERVGLAEADRKPVGAGPYKVGSFVPNKSVELERFDDYWGEKAPIKKVTYTFIPEIASRITAVANNEVDMIVGIPPDQEPALANQKDLKLLGTAWPLFHVYVLNMSHPVMANPKLRQALDLSIDREALVKALWANKGIVPTSLQFPDYGDMYMPEVKTVEYNVEKAAQLVKESGYDGTPIVITIRADYYTYGDLAAQAVIEMWKKIGVNAKLQQVPDVNKIPDSEIMIRSWSNPLYYPDPMGVMDASWAENIWVSTRKLFTPQNKEWFTNFKVARFSTDTQERKTAYKKLLEIAKEEAGFILLYQPYENYVMRQDIHWKIPKNYRAETISLRAGEVGRIEKPQK